MEFDTHMGFFLIYSATAEQHLEHLCWGCKPNSVMKGLVCKLMKYIWSQLEKSVYGSVKVIVVMYLVEYVILDNEAVL